MRRLCLGLVLAATLLSAGCWDARSLEQRAFLVMMGIDRTEGGQYRVSMQMQRAGAGEEVKGGQAPKPSVRFLTGEGETIRTAMEKATGNLLARELDTSFLDVIVLGRKAADNLEELDWIVRSFRVNTTAFVVVAPEEAEPVIRAFSPGFGVPQQFALFGLLPGGWSRSPTIIGSTMWLMFNRNYYTPLEDPYAAVLIVGSEGLEWNGMAVWEGHHLAGYLGPEDAVIYNLLSGGRVQRTIAADVPQFPGARVAIAIQTARVRRKVTWEADRPVIHLQVSARGDLQRLTATSMTSPEVETALQRALAGQLAAEIRTTIGRWQELNSDPVGFGELARQAAPYRREVQSGAAWHAAFRKARLDIRTTVTIVAPGYMK